MDLFNARTLCGLNRRPSFTMRSLAIRLTDASCSRTPALLERYRPVVADGYVNLYALFVEQALQWVRPGGVVCLIIPMSFVGGPYFAALRERILKSASVLRLDLIDKRSDVFLDVLYDLCVVVLRKSGGPGRPSTPKSSLLRIGEPDLDLGLIDLPAQPDKRVWVLPDVKDNNTLFRPGFETLAGYGYLTKTGYFVWNREKHRYRAGQRPRASEVPLFSAHNVRANQRCEPRDDETAALGFAKIPKSSTAIIHSDAVILQRTSNRRQRRRLMRRHRAPQRRDRRIDAEGFRWLRRIFEAATPECRKILILRNADRYAVELGVEHAEWLRALHVFVHDYHLSHDAASGRQLPIETFHAKLVVADETLSYVGSANLLSSSEGLCLETGFLVEGAAASDVARLVDAVLRVARAL